MPNGSLIPATASRFLSSHGSLYALTLSCSEKEIQRGGPRIGFPSPGDGMSNSAIRIEPRVVEVTCTTGALHVRVADGRELAVPLEWFPRLRNASPKQLARYRLIGDGIGVHWPELDEAISVEGLFATRSRIGASRIAAGVRHI